MIFFVNTREMFNFGDKWCNFLSFSVAVNHFKELIGGFIWAISNIKHNGSFNISAGNHLLATVIDSLLGVMLLRWLLGIASAQILVSSVVEATDEGVVLLRSLLSFLMGSPGGLKLNLPFNIALGRFFMYNTNLWWVFLDQCQPLLVLACHAFEWLGLFGITTHLAIVSDLLALASFHAYCIYVYAARLFSLQIKGLVALWRLFLGRKWNPLRQCVDSCDYRPSQLFAGVLAFTVLLFLLPTTIVYYGVFTTLRLLFLAIEGLLFRIRSHIQSFPLLAFIMWLLGCKAICLNVSMHLMPSKSKDSKELILEMRHVRAPLGQVIELATKAVPITKPPSIQWMYYLRNIATGTLF